MLPLRSGSRVELLKANCDLDVAGYNGFFAEYVGTFDLTYEANFTQSDEIIVKNNGVEFGRLTREEPGSLFYSNEQGFGDALTFPGYQSLKTLEYIRLELIWEETLYGALFQYSVRDPSIAPVDQRFSYAWCQE